MIPLAFILALIQVESHGNDRAIGSEGEVGCLQITPAVVDDVNRILKSSTYEYNDRYDRAKSIAMCQVYLGYYARLHSLEGMARIWNGGPAGVYRPGTVAYWKKVRMTLLDQGLTTVGDERVGP